MKKNNKLNELYQKIQTNYIKINIYKVIQYPSIDVRRPCMCSAGSNLRLIHDLGLVGRRLLFSSRRTKHISLYILIIYLILSLSVYQLAFCKEISYIVSSLIILGKILICFFYIIG